MNDYNLPEFVKTKTYAQALAEHSLGTLYFPTDEPCIIFGLGANANDYKVIGLTNAEKTKLGNYPAIGSGTSTYLRNDGQWVTPPDSHVTSHSNHYDPSVAAEGGTLSWLDAGDTGGANPTFEDDTDTTRYIVSGLKLDDKGHVVHVKGKPMNKSSVGLSNVTNDKQVKGLASGTTNGHVVVWGTDGYTVADSGFTLGKSVPADALFTDTNTWRGITNSYNPAEQPSDAISLSQKGANNMYQSLQQAISSSVAGLASQLWVGWNYIPLSQRGAANGVATLDANGLVPSTQLPSYVDDVIEIIGCYEYNGALYRPLENNKLKLNPTSSDFVAANKISPTGSPGTYYMAIDHNVQSNDPGIYHYVSGSSWTREQGENGKIYIESSTGKQYRFAVNSYIPSEVIASPGTLDNVLDGSTYKRVTETQINNWNTAYSHATDTNRLTTATAVGLYKVGCTAEGHIVGLTAVAKSDITALGIPGGWRPITDAYNPNGSGDSGTSLSQAGAKAMYDTLTQYADSIVASYLPLAGGTMRGNASVTFPEDSFINYTPTASWGSWARIPYSITVGNDVVGFGAYGTSGQDIKYAFIGSSHTSNNAIRIYPNSAPCVGGNTIIHSGNIGSQSVSNADTLDNYHASAFIQQIRVNGEGNWINPSSGRVDIPALPIGGGTITGNLTVDGTTTLRCGYFNNTNPSLGALGTGTFSIRAQAYNGITTAYGLFAWSDANNGMSKLQGGYTDGTATALNLVLQPLGGKVAIGYSGNGSGLNDTLHVHGTANVSSNMTIGGSLSVGGNDVITAGNIGSQSVASANQINELRVISTGTTYDTYKRIATCELTYKYDNAGAVIRYRATVSTGNEYGTYGTLYINTYQQNPIGNSSAITFLTDIENPNITFYAVETLTNTKTTVDIYAKINISYHAIQLSFISGNLTVVNDEVSTLPSGTGIRTITASYTKVRYALNSDTVNGKTVEKNVPSTAVFTDQSVTQYTYHYDITDTSAGGADVSKSVRDADNTHKFVTGVTLDQRGHIRAFVGTNVEWTDIDNKPSSMPASDVYSWAKASTKPSYTASEVGALPISGGTLEGNINTPAFRTGTDSSGFYIEGLSEYGIRIQYAKTVEGGSRRNYDQLFIANGEIKFSSNNSTTENTIYHSGNLTNVSQLNNDSGFITSSGSCSHATTAGSATTAGTATSAATAASATNATYAEQISRDAGLIGLWRTNDDYKSGMYYSTPGNEAVVFGNKRNVTSWIFATTNPYIESDWQNLTPSLQIKNQCVAINKLIPNGSNGSYNLDVNGSINGTSIYVNGTAVLTGITSSMVTTALGYTPPTANTWRPLGTGATDACAGNDNRLNSVRYDTSSQGLTDTQKYNARINIGAASKSDLHKDISTTASRCHESLKVGSNSYRVYEQICYMDGNNYLNLTGKAVYIITAYGMNYRGGCASVDINWDGSNKKWKYAGSASFDYIYVKFAYNPTASGSPSLSA